MWGMNVCGVCGVCVCAGCVCVGGWFLDSICEVSLSQPAESAPPLHSSLPVPISAMLCLLSPSLSVWISLFSFLHTAISAIEVLLSPLPLSLSSSLVLMLIFILSLSIRPSPLSPLSTLSPLSAPSSLSPLSSPSPPCPVSLLFPLTVSRASFKLSPFKPFKPFLALTRLLLSLSTALSLSFSMLFSILFPISLL